jgi:ketosteroid isomerase-like protein
MSPSSVLFLATLLFRPAAPDVVQEITRLEQQLTDALVRNDVSAVDRLWSEDLIFIGTDGKASTKARRLAGMSAPASSGDAVVAATNDDVKVRLYGQTAVVTLLSTWKVHAGERDFSDRYMTTHIWTRQRGRWQLVAAHVSKVAQ